MPKIMLNSVEYTGGGGDSGMELTYDEYLALPEEEKNNGTTYYINDINGAGKDQFQPVIYSTEEREIGVWIDGRPLYQKTFRATSSSSTSTAAILAETGAGTEIVDFFGTINGARDIISNLDTNQWSYSWIAANKYQLGNFAKGTSYAGLPTVTTCRYIKTADTAGSGTWTPSGVPAVHYSTNEQVVGTWIDGKTVYEKILTYTNKSQQTSDWTTLETFSDIDHVVKLDGFIDVSNGQRMFTQYYFRLVFQNNALKYYCTELATGNGDITVTLQYTKTTS